jgi:hypothetical protein
MGMDVDRGDAVEIDTVFVLFGWHFRSVLRFRRANAR